MCAAWHPRSRRRPRGWDHRPVGSEIVSLRAHPPDDAVLPERHPDAPAPGQQIDSHYHRCFGCGDDHSTGLHLHVVAGEGLTLAGRFTVTEDHQGAPGLAHGGLLSLAFDEALGALAWLVRLPAVTARLETDYRRPVPVGTTLHITARVDGMKGRRLYVSAEGRSGQPAGPVAVRARAVFAIVPLEHFRTFGRAEDVAAALARSEVRDRAAAFEVNP
jgi:acyl-coenzyme A thioesterase PaaI-like protein